MEEQNDNDSSLITYQNIVDSGEIISPFKERELQEKLLRSEDSSSKEDGKQDK